MIIIMGFVIVSLVSVIEYDRVRDNYLGVHGNYYRVHDNYHRPRNN